MSDQSDSIRPVRVTGQMEPIETKPCSTSCALHVDVVIEDDRWGGLARLDKIIDETGRSVASVLGIAESADVALALSNDAHVAKLNEAYRGQNKPTNVLSFPAVDQSKFAQAETDGDDRGPSSRRRYLGDIIMAFETLSSEAVESQIPVEDHFRHILVHGLLHLMGFDHGTEPEAHRMETTEIEILAALGIADPYGVSEATS